MRLPFNYENAESLTDEMITANIAACYEALRTCEDDDAEAIEDMIAELDSELRDRHQHQ